MLRSFQIIWDNPAEFQLVFVCLNMTEWGIFCGSLEKDRSRKCDSLSDLGFAPLGEITLRHKV